MQHYTKFIWRICAFTGMVLLTVTIIWNIVIFTRSQLCYQPDKTVVVLGTSRIQYGVDDSIMPEVWNVGLNADNYNLIYWKLKLLHKYNKQLQTVILEVDQTTLFDYFEGVEYKLHPYYWDVMDFTDWARLLAKDRTILMYPFDWIKILIPIKSIFSPVAFQELGIGGYSKLYRDKLSESLQRESTHPNTAINQYEIDGLQLEYLNKIITYCQHSNIAIEFISMPSYHTPTIEIGHNRANQYIKTSFPNVKYHDYELVELADSCYGDITHLNYKGANVLSQKLKTDLTDD